MNRILKKAIVMIGVPGSGKTTKAVQFKKDLKDSGNEVSYISSDDIRQEILGDVNNQTQNEKVFNIVHHKIRESIKNEKTIIVDATNINIKSRKGILECFKNSEYEKIAYIMNTPIEKCKENNCNRERQVPEYVIDRQVRKFEVPFYEEGFDTIVFNYTPLNCFNSDCVIKNILQSMDGFNQKNHHHKYDLGTHCRKVAEEIKARTNDELLYKTALIHDIGKLYVGEEKDDGSREFSYKQHHNYGAYLLLCNPDFINSMNKQDILEILFYVNYHMIPFFIQSEKSEKKWKQIFGEKKYNNLFLFNECDKIGSGTRD